MNTAMRFGMFCVILALVLVAAGTAAGDTYVINPQGTGDYATIQAAVDAADDGDVIVLTDGTFTGDGNRDIVVPSKDITIRSQSYNYNTCIIDCQGSARAAHRGFCFGADVGSGYATLSYVSIINGYTTGNGAGIQILGCSPEIRSCAIAMCTAASGAVKGGGIYVGDGADPYIIGCLVSVNTADYGGGIAVINSGGTYFSCEIGDNTATETGGGVYIESTEALVFNYCSIVSNTAQRAGGVRLQGAMTSFFNGNISRNEATAGHSGGVWLEGGGLSICTIVENSATTGGGGVHSTGGSGLIELSIIAFSEDGYGVSADAPENAPYITCCDVFGNAGGNYDSVVGDQTGVHENFSADPEFCDIENADYSLYETSLCLGTLSPCGEQVGRYGQGCDSPVEGMSWGRLKAMWR